MKNINYSNMPNRTSNGAESKAHLLRKIREYSFALVETNLFLDTHPSNRKALLYFNKIKKMYEELVKEYESKYGALTAMGNESDDEWTWIKNPWPWEGEC